MAEFLVGNGITGDTFEEGRRKINAFFTATTDSEIASKGLSVQSILVNNALSGTTDFYSGTTNLNSILNSGPFRQETVVGDRYKIIRDYKGDGHITSTIYITGTTELRSLDFIPVISGLRFKYQWYNQTIVGAPDFFTERAGEIQFNNLERQSITETFSILGNEVGHYQYLNDPTASITFNPYGGYVLPSLDTSGITATFYPDALGPTSNESGVTRVFVLEGLLV